MNYKDNPGEYLATISPNRMKSVKQPEQSWKGRAKCFQLFDHGLKPSDISPRQCRVSRRTLYRYFQDWKIMQAKIEMTILQARRELAELRRSQSSRAPSGSISIPKCRH
jgi:hypothetical protein